MATLLLVPASAGAQEKRFALLIGNHAYDPSVGVPKNPRNVRGIVGETPEKQKFGILPPVMDTTEVSGRVGLAEA